MHLNSQRLSVGTRAWAAYEETNRLGKTLGATTNQDDKRQGS